MITRPHKEAAELNSVVGGVLDDIRRRGDAAVKEYEQKFDKVALDSLKVTDEEIREAEAQVGDDLKAALQMAILLKAGHEFDSFVYLPLTLVNVDNVADLEGWR